MTSKIRNRKIEKIRTTALWLSSIFAFSRAATAEKQAWGKEEYIVWNLIPKVKHYNFLKPVFSRDIPSKVVFIIQT